MPQLKVQNLYNTTITEVGWIPASWDCDFTVSTPPENSNWFIIISPENPLLREIMYYHNVVGNRIYVRWENRKSPKAHAATEVVKMNDVAEIFNYFSDMVSQLFYTEKTGGLTVKVWWGYTSYNWSTVTVPDTSLTLIDNATNYIKYDYPTNTISSSTSSGGNVKVVVTTVSGAITNIEYRNAKESFIDFSVTIEWALPDQSWNAGKVLITDGTNISWWSVLRPTGNWLNKILWTDWTWTVTEYTKWNNTQVLLWDLTLKSLSDFSQSALVDQQYIAWENISVWDSVFYEYSPSFTASTIAQRISEVTTNTRVVIPFIWTWTVMNTFKLSLSKSWTPTQNINFRIETDNWSGLPSWTLLDTNATASIAPWSLTTSLVDTTVTLAWSVTPSLWTQYYIVIFQWTYWSETVNNVNYYNIWTVWMVSNLRKTLLYNGTSYSSLWIATQHYQTNWASSWSWTFADTTLTVSAPWYISSVLRRVWTTWTTCTIIQWWTTLATASFVWNTAAFSSPVLIYPWTAVVRVSAASSVSIQAATTTTTAASFFSIWTTYWVEYINWFKPVWMWYVSWTWISEVLVSKTEARDYNKLPITPMVVSTSKNKWEYAIVSISWLQSILWTSNSSPYYVWNLPWSISTTVGSYKYPLWIGLWGSLLLSKNISTPLVSILSVNAATTSAWVYHHGWTLLVNPVATNTSTVTIQTSNDNWVSYSTYHTISMNWATQYIASIPVPQWFVRIQTSSSVTVTVFH